MVGVLADLTTRLLSVLVSSSDLSVSIACNLQMTVRNLNSRDCDCISRCLSARGRKLKHLDGTELNY